jgi:hypothetical protein
MARLLDNWIDSDFLMLRDLNIAVARILYGLYGLYGGMVNGENAKLM